MSALNIFTTFISTVGFVTTVLSVVIILTALISWFLGIYPLLKRFGLARWKRNIAIAADDDPYNSLKNDLTKAEVFREKNIYQIKKNSLSQIKDSSLVLIDYQSFSEDEIKTILRNKQNKAGFIFYFPEFEPANTMIPKEMLIEINNEPFTTVVNFRGRLINDIVVTMISTSYD
ncbi:hypothetical protein COX05_04175 [candidate division WWE3 bacterium CG22_combo_CG10-13_8_21_14_all_39_12]|uniref:Uncharacterized protein n=1 Tax=candidate division WWE3 bacterium CG22_combo_CG10-13_8_21_14_all_39_12 TaxID=1975094 RepID=A0A2H0BGW3_UNCKA|nr:MAG: hypothetical protein COX05_04175 [candidate division WWE3 bacterium CG22_combo_CG10-13_8_21_14_all_39_12]